MEKLEKTLRCQIDDYTTDDGSKDQSQMRALKAKQEQFNSVLAQVVAKYKQQAEEIKVRLQQHIGMNNRQHSQIIDSATPINEPNQ